MINPERRGASPVSNQKSAPEGACPTCKEVFP